MDYELVPISGIKKTPRLIAISWVEGFGKSGGLMLQEKHKLASDIMNYAKEQSLLFAEWLEPSYRQYGVSGAWFNIDNPRVKEGTVFTTSELYELFNSDIE